MSVQQIHAVIIRSCPDIASGLLPERQPRRLQAPLRRSGNVALVRFQRRMPHVLFRNIHRHPGSQVLGAARIHRRHRIGAFPKKRL